MNIVCRCVFIIQFVELFSINNLVVIEIVGFLELGQGESFNKMIFYYIRISRVYCLDWYKKKIFEVIFLGSFFLEIRR